LLLLDDFGGDMEGKIQNASGKTKVKRVKIGARRCITAMASCHELVLRVSLRDIFELISNMSKSVNLRDGLHDTLRPNLCWSRLGASGPA
ncbi:hypothetical protein HAX54_017653, partial [Datura stramonium]|nr:hypothetical protein [Datura stramonium]